MLTPLYLPDVNVLTAALLIHHEHHDTANTWFESNHADGWATCPMTQSSTIRVMRQYSLERGPLVTIDTLARRLNASLQAPTHVFIHDDLEFTSPEVIDFPRVQGHRQLTDLHLLALAIKHDMRLVTLDRRIDYKLVKNAKPDDIILLQ